MSVVISVNKKLNLDGLLERIWQASDLLVQDSIYYKKTFTSRFKLDTWCSLLPLRKSSAVVGGVQQITHICKTFFQ